MTDECRGLWATVIYQALRDLREATRMRWAAGDTNTQSGSEPDLRSAIVYLLGPGDALDLHAQMVGIDVDCIRARAREDLRARFPGLAPGDELEAWLAAIEAELGTRGRVDRLSRVADHG